MNRSAQLLRVNNNVTSFFQNQFLEDSFNLIAGYKGGVQRDM